MEERIACSNAALAIFAAGVSLEFKGRRCFVKWTAYGGEPTRKQWITSGNDFYPTWHARRGYWGGTCSTAMSQLIRWCQGKPVLPLGCFRNMCGGGVKLAGERGGELISLLAAGGYPEEVPCVKCGGELKGLGWYNDGGVSGPGCRRDLCPARRVTEIKV